MVRGPPSSTGCLLATALLLVLGLGPALGSSLDLGEEARATEGGECTSAATGVAPDGSVHIVYTTYDGEVSVWHLLASPEGETLAGPTLVSPAGTADLMGIDVDVDGRGVAHAVMSVATGDDLYTDVHYARLSAGGDLEVGPRRVFTSPHHSYDPRLAVDDAGVARVAFNDMGVREVRWLRVGTSGSREGECVVVSNVEGRTAQTDMPAT